MDEYFNGSQTNPARPPDYDDMFIELLSVGYWELPHYGYIPNDSQITRLSYCLLGTPYTTETRQSSPVREGITIGRVPHLWFDFNHMEEAYATFKYQFSKGDPKVEWIADDSDPFQSLPHVDVDIRGVTTRLYCFDGEWIINLGPAR